MVRIRPPSRAFCAKVLGGVLVVVGLWTVASSAEGASLACGGTEGACPAASAASSTAVADMTAPRARARAKAKSPGSPPAAPRPAQIPSPVPGGELAAKPDASPASSQGEDSALVRPEVPAGTSGADDPAATEAAPPGDVVAPDPPATPPKAAPGKSKPKKAPAGAAKGPSPAEEGSAPGVEPGVPGVAGFRTNLEAMKPQEIKAVPAKGVPQTLSAVVLKAIYDSALIKATEGGAMDALASIGVAEANLYPQIEGRLGVGPSVVGDWQAPGSPGAPYFNSKKTYGAGRADALLTGTQLVYDFGATRSNIAKSAAATESQNWNVLSTVEDVAYRASDAYLKVLQARAVLALTEENVKTLQEIASLVVENQRNGNGTVADVKRVNGRLVEARSTRADEELALQLASDQLRRLIRVDPGPLLPVPTLSKALPGDEAKALGEALKASPRIRAYKASIESREAEIAYLKNGAKPKLSADVTAGNKQYQAVNDKTSLDATAFLTLSYKFADGGLVSSQIEQARARVFQDEMRMRDESETMENELRQAYFTIKIARGKTQSLAQGVDDNFKARALYREQFAGGKRTLLELLEVQNAYFVAKRTQIVNMFEEQRATFTVLRSLGRLAVTAIRSR